MKNFVQEGNVLTLTAPTGGVLSGKPVAVGSVVVVPVSDADAGDSFGGHRCGVFSIDTAGTPTEGAKAYITGAGQATVTASGNTLVGVFVSAKDASGFSEVLFTGQIA
jgi:predicted RecA/RadA family phage recombinase